MSFSSIVSTANLKTAAIAALAVLLVNNLFATSSTMIRGAATVGAIAVALPLASKF